MSRAYHNLVRQLLIVSFLVSYTTPLPALTSLAKNDPDPVFSSPDPHTFLYDKQRLGVKDPDVGVLKHAYVSLSLSPFGQTANSGRGATGCQFLPVDVSFEQVCVGTDCTSSDTSFASGTTACPTTIVDCIKGQPIELGDITGRTNMIALLYGDLPQGQTLPPSLLDAQNALFPGMEPINDPSLIDPNQQYASFSIPLKYRKYGVRFDLSANIAGGFGINVQTGIVNIRQELACQIKDLTCVATNTCNFTVPNPNAPDGQNQVEKFLMQPFDIITQQLCVNTRDFNETSVEEVRFNAFWRRAYEMNFGLQPEYPPFLIMPFIVLSGSVSPGKKVHPNQFFALPFGNNGHNAVGFTTGLSLDFLDTIEIACEVGGTHFSGRTIPCMRMPNNMYQKTLFPFTTDVRLHPGMNWNFAAKIGAYHFLHNLSAYFQFMMINHEQDSYKIVNCDPAFTPEALKRVSPWKVKVANIGFNYDISPNISLGFFWQAPLSQRNAYRSTTVMGSFNATF